MFFEYRCFESPESQDSLIWYHSHQEVTVLSEVDSDGKGKTRKERNEDGTPLVYLVRFHDGFECPVFEDELLESVDMYERPEPHSMINTCQR